MEEWLEPSVRLDGGLEATDFIQLECKVEWDRVRKVRDF